MLAITNLDISILALVVGAIMLVLFKELAAATFDAESACGAAGRPSRQVNRDQTPT